MHIFLASGGLRYGPSPPRQRHEDGAAVLMVKRALGVMVCVLGPWR